MSDEKKLFSRRSFLKGAAATGVAAAAGTGLFVKDLGAQVRSKFDAREMALTRKFMEPPGVMVDNDVVPLAESLGKASLEAAYDAFNLAAEQFVKGRDRSIHTGKMLEIQGLKLRSTEAKSAAKSFNVPASILKVRELQLKQKGWHSHCSWRASAFCCNCDCHWHVTW